MELNSLRCAAAKDVDETVNKALTLKGKLNNLGIEIDGTLMIGAPIKALPNSFKTFLDHWSMLDVESQTQSRFIEKLLERTKSLSQDEEKAMIAAQVGRPNWKPQYHRGQPSRPQFNRQGVSPLHSANARQPQSDRGPTHGDKFSVICHYCKKLGHFKSECRKLMRKAAADGTHSPSQQCNVASMSFMAIESTTNLFELVADSGCTSHMSPRREWLCDYKSFAEPIKIRIGDDSIILALGSGTIKTNVGKLTNCYYVPDLCANLFSISAACDLGIDFQFDQNGLVGRLNNQPVLTGCRSDLRPGHESQ